MNSASVLLVLSVALERTSGHKARVAEEAASFALSAAGLMSVAFVNASVLLAVALLAAHPRGESVATTLRLGSTRATPIGVTAAIVGMVGLSFGCATAGELLGVRAGGVMDRVARALEKPTPAELVLAVVTIGLSPAFAEETFFRGLMQPWLTSRGRRWPAIVATSFGFGIMHLDPVQGSLAFLAGVFLGWTAERLGGVRPTIAAHTVNNVIFVVLSSIGSSDPGSRRAKIVVLALGATAWAVSVAVLRSRQALRP